MIAMRTKAAAYRALAARLPGQQRGAATLEFAVAAGVLLMLILVTIEMSLMLWAHMTLQYAVREGARYAVVDHGDIGGNPRCQDVIGVIQRNSMGLTGLLSPRYDIEVNDHQTYRLEAGESCRPGMFGGRGDLMVLRLTANWPVATPYLHKLLGGPGYRFSVAATMQNEKQ